MRPGNQGAGSRPFTYFAMNRPPLVKNTNIAVVGLGYVGLPLAVEFAKYYKVFGFDLNEERVNQLNAGFDHTLEIEEEALKKVLVKDCTSVKGLYVTDNRAHIRNCNVFIITVPTPVDKHHSSTHRNKRPPSSLAGGRRWD